MTNPTPITLTFDWPDLETQLMELADGPSQKEMIPFLVSGIKKQKPFLTPDMLLREILSVTACIADARFPPAMACASLGSDTPRGSGSSL